MFCPCQGSCASTVFASVFSVLRNIRVKHRVLDLHGDMVREVRHKPGKVGD